MFLPPLHFALQHSQCPQWHMENSGIDWLTFGYYKLATIGTLFFKDYSSEKPRTGAKKVFKSVLKELEICFYHLLQYLGCYQLDTGEIIYVRFQLGCAISLICKIMFVLILPPILPFAIYRPHYRLLITTDPSSARLHHKWSQKIFFD